jgi:4-hydroxybenzoate polyprenyltransferase
MPNNQDQTKYTYLVVDLDKTLIHSDSFSESCSVLIQKHPFQFFKLPGLIIKGQAHLKRFAADRAIPDVHVLPYNQTVIEFVKKHRSNTLKTILVSSSDQQLVDKVNEHLKLFDYTAGSNGVTVNTGEKKLAAVMSICKDAPFIYMGNSPSDIPLWNAAKKAVIVNKSDKILKRISKKSTEITFLQTPHNSFAPLKAMRVYQWVKNLLLFIPILLAHQIANAEQLKDLFSAFIAMSLSASAIYIFNDFFDMESDRHHPTKRNRPFASGQLQLLNGALLFIVLLSAGFTIAITAVSFSFTFFLLVYVLLTLLYSLHLKKLIVIDVAGLASLYTIRILAGGNVVQVEVSPWLLVFSIFLFLSLAFAKRYTELLGQQLSGNEEIKGRGYQASDHTIVLCSGIASAYMSVTIFFLYITNSPLVQSLYKHPFWLWLIGPIILIWISRIWFLAHRRILNEDPVIYAIKDYVSWIMGILCVGLVLLSV